MKILGGVILVLCAFLVARAYRGFVRDGISQSEAFLDLLLGIERQVAVSGAPIDRYISGAKNRVLSSIGFYREYMNSQSLYVAFCGIRHRLFMPNGIKKAIETTFSEMGKGDISGELRLINAATSEIKEMITGYRTEAERSVRVVAVILVAATLGLLIILV